MPAAFQAPGKASRNLKHSKMIGYVTLTGTVEGLPKDQSRPVR
jgi:hypothetical protein